ncbi:arsenate reductase (glutaredoxin) [Echinicola vietnamensis]|uniref:Glutaredoxin-dependent arsenate reductase n=1 Tax=Echinicola vietnamensis (strain DSM 17526 / LMG 23754 / KMM 6221) TaxID=926556 RepID=L0FZP5_ECHVK|nr:arsenate reductase (glutaredoxin) [Echinicola vietnamensis]AGA78782.1 glutaredoxin-dependent arsenate reductase [Echinicola vietnamensis DSM 17526]
MSKVKIFHNPRCGKSRETLKLLQEKMSDDQIEVVKYLEEIPSPEELKNVLSMLGIKAEELVRKNEKLWKENFKGQSYSEDELVQLMVDNPKLIERPIVLKGDKAVIGRPPENVYDII